MRLKTLHAKRDGAERRHQVTLLNNRTWVALAALAETDPANAVSDQLLAAAPSVQKLSLRNQIMLLIQAGEKNLVLRDVDTYAGWGHRGRVPTEPGLRIVRAYDPRPGQAASTTAQQPSVFGKGHRWDFAQTAPLDDCADPQDVPDTAGDPAAFAEHLLDQFARYRYRAEPGPTGEVDHEAHVVTAAEAAMRDEPATAARVLIKALASVLITEPGNRRPAEGVLRAG